VGATASTSLSGVQKGRLAFEILCAYGRVRWLLRRETLPALVAALRARTWPRAAVVTTAAGVEGLRLGRAVVRTITPLPSGSRCLTRSLVLLSILASRGVHGELVIAVQPLTEPTFDAHAWVEVDGRPLLAPAPDYGRLLTL
jgi:hypothetical protein